MLSAGRKKELQRLVRKYQQGKASPEEIRFIETYYDYFQDRETNFSELSNKEKAEVEKKIWTAIETGMEENPQIIPIYRRTWLRVAAAAAIIVLLATVSYFLFSDKTRDTKQLTNVMHDVSPPSASRASLKLSDGRIIYLDSARNGALAFEANVDIMKTADGKLVYNQSDDIKGMVQYNYLSNPRGSKVIDVTLADGSRVWLNAGSSLTYPVSFVGAERMVNITGEAYFEVAHNEQKPFYVSKGDMQVKVLGTKFNVNAFDDETDIKVTLLEGSVNVSNHGDAVTLIPGQQGRITSNLKPQTLNNIDLSQVLAWKNGKFDFGLSTSIQDIMRQVSRWYDVEIEYKSKIDQSFGGSISRQVNVSKVLEKFELTGTIKFLVQGKRIIVMK